MEGIKKGVSFNMKLPKNKTKIVCTLGPASDSPEVMEQMIRAGMNVARLNFSHGDFAGHRKVIEHLRASARGAGRRVAIMADLPGPKIRIGQFAKEPVHLKSGDLFTLTTEAVPGDESRVSVTFEPLLKAVKPGDTVFLNDGFIQLEAVKIEGKEVRCRVVVGGELRSRKGLNLPGIDLGISAFTERDLAGLKFAAECGLDAVSQSFVQSGADIEAVRRAADRLDYHPLIIAKIERSRALDSMGEILQAADGIMIARGDLGVEIPIEQIAVVQKRLMRQANLLGKPVITATQMLESMTENRRPTRAESTDVANAILDGTDCVMLSGESAMGKYPVDAVAMLARIAEAVEPHRPASDLSKVLKEAERGDKVNLADLIAFSVGTTLERVSPAVVFVPTRSGYTARSIARFRLPVWVAAVSSQEATCQRLQFSYGVYPVHEPNHPEDWKSFVGKWLLDHGVTGDLVVLTEGPSTKHPEMNNRMEIIDLKKVR
jgi:pyruvate kinase